MSSNSKETQHYISTNPTQDKWFLEEASDTVLRVPINSFVKMLFIIITVCLRVNSIFLISLKMCTKEKAFVGSSNFILAFERQRFPKLTGYMLLAKEFFVLKLRTSRSTTKIWRYRLENTELKASPEEDQCTSLEILSEGLNINPTTVKKRLPKLEFK